MYPQSSTGQLTTTIRGFLIVLLFVSACGTQKELPSATRSVVGILYVTGNEPFVHLALQTPDGGTFRIRKDTSALYRELRKLQGQKLRLQFKSVDSVSDISIIAVERYDIVKAP